MDNNLNGQDGLAANLFQELEQIEESSGKRRAEPYCPRTECPNARETRAMHSGGSDLSGRVPKECGGCNACCVLYTVPEMGKPRMTPCQHLCERGCGIHEAPRPPICTDFRCFWLREPSLGDDLRPDRCKIIYNPSGVQLQDRFGRWHEVWQGAMLDSYAYLRRANKRLIDKFRRTNEILVLTHQGKDSADQYWWSCLNKYMYPGLTQDRIRGLLERHGQQTDSGKAVAQFYGRGTVACK